MPVAAIASIALGLILAGAIAFYLFRVVLILRSAVDSLGKVTFGVRAIAFRTEPIEPVLADVNANLTAVAEALEGLVSSPADTVKAS
ncbi:MAG: hypothetical protein OSA99_21125 [Acidimicrobiales bacterium]|nr:hypothetical protein [Acidimicrobiales bacterium]